MGICFYTHWTLFQIYNGYLKKKFYAANIANKVTPLILIKGGAYAVFRLLGEERINNRMSLAIVLKSALTFLHRRNPEFARWPGLPVPRRAVFAPLSHQFTVEVGRQPGLGRKTPSKKVHIKLETKPKRLQRRKKRKAEGGGRGPESCPLLGSIGFFKKTKQNKKNKNNEQWLQKRKSCAQTSTCGCRASEVGGRARPLAPLPCRTRLYHATCAFQDILPKES